MGIVLHEEVDKFILTLQKPTRSKWLRQLELLRQYGVNLGMPHVRRMNVNLSELRIRGTQEVRAFFAIHEERIIILHAYIKKTQKTPQKEIDIAQKRQDLLTDI